MRITEKDQREIHGLTQQAQIASLKSRIADLERDGERLDWLESHHAQIYRFPTGAKLTVWPYKNFRDEQFFIDTSNARQAIDAAIIASQKPDGGGSGK